MLIQFPTYKQHPNFFQPPFDTESGRKNGTESQLGKGSSVVVNCWEPARKKGKKMKLTVWGKIEKKTRLDKKSVNVGFTYQQSSFKIGYKTDIGRENLRHFNSLFFLCVFIGNWNCSSLFFVASESTEDKFLLTSDHLLRDICLFLYKQTNVKVCEKKIDSWKTNVDKLSLNGFPSHSWKKLRKPSIKLMNLKNILSEMWLTFSLSKS